MDRIKDFVKSRNNGGRAANGTLKGHTNDIKVLTKNQTAHIKIVHLLLRKCLS